MNRMHIYPVIALLIVILCQCEKSSPTDLCGLNVSNETSPQHLKVLFIGNSHTYTYNIPETIRLMAESKGDSLEYTMSAPGGFDFESHYVFPPTLLAIKSQDWDYVVLQESGWRTALPHAMADSMIYPYADSLAEIIKNNNASTEILLFMTQGYRDGVLTFNDEKWCEIDPEVCTYEGMQGRIQNTYLKLSEKLDAEIAPAGTMWNVFFNKHSDISLFQPDGIHANPEGSYLSACVIYSVIFRKKAEDIYVSANVNSNSSLKIQTTVSDALFDCNPDWKSYLQNWR